MTPAVIPSGSTILLDSMTVIYFLEQHEQYGELARQVFQRIESGDLRGLMTSLVFAELLVPLYRSKKAETVRQFVDVLSNYRHLTILEVSTEISMEAARLRARYGLRTPDAIHGATALLGQADGILTNDKNFNHLANEGLNIWLFDQFI